MKERPILFSRPMVEARRAGRKNQTRRNKGLEYINQAPGEWKVLRPLQEFEPIATGGTQHFPGWEPGYWVALKNPAGIEDMGYLILSCPYGVVGDRLWVKETYYAKGGWRKRYSEKKGRDEWYFVDITQESGLEYRYLDNPPSIIEEERSIHITGWYKRPSLFMPRASSRMLLEITELRPERLQQISHADAIAEGVFWCEEIQGYTTDMEGRNFHASDPRASYNMLWDSINRENAWDGKEWVWVVGFEEVK